jgi:hypothetical protein
MMGRSSASQWPPFQMSELTLRDGELLSNNPGDITNRPRWTSDSSRLSTPWLVFAARAFPFLIPFVSRFEPPFVACVLALSLGRGVVVARTLLYGVYGARK